MGTQAGIKPQGGSMIYRWKADPGTHFYHAHMQALQADRGLKGPIVVHAKQDPHASLYQEEKVITLSDEWQDPGACLKAEGAQPGNPVCMEIEKATWIGVWGDGSKEYPWPKFTVEQGKCYRLRFIGMLGQAQNFQIAIAGHNMTLIALDGADVVPINLSQINLHAGERADVVVCANQEPGKASHKLLGGYNPPAGTGGGKNPAPSAGPAWDTNLAKNWDVVKNLHPKPELPEADVSYTLDVGVLGPSFQPGASPYATTDRMYMFTKHQSWSKPSTPLLHTQGKCGAENVPFLTFEKNQTVELVINNLSPTAHVLHMHGMRFQVINYAPFSSTWCSNAHFECFFL